MLRESELMMAGSSRAHRWNRMLPEVATKEERPNIGKNHPKKIYKSCQCKGSKDQPLAVVFITILAARG